MLGSSAALGCSLLLPDHLLAFAGGEVPAGATASAVLDALPGKRPLIKRTFRPPNYETPVALFRHEFTPNDAFYVRWHTGVPDLALDGWRLRVAGPAAGTSREFTHGELLRRFRLHEVAAVNQCSGNRRGLFAPHVPGVQWGYGAMGNARWRGVRLKDVLEDAGIAPGAIEVAADGADQPTLTGPDFVKSLPIWKALDADTLIAFEMNGEPLSRWNGFPARLVVPGWTATYWVKALTELRVLDRPFDGFWMKTGYRVPRNLLGPSHFDSQDTAQQSPITAIRVNSLFVDPAPGAKLAAGRHHEILGIAWDGGVSWHEATLGRDLGRYAWRQWRFRFKPAGAGVHSLMARARSRDGSVQPDALVQNPAGYHHNVVQRAAYHAV